MLDIPPHSFYVMLAVIGVLVIATAIQYLMAIMRPQQDQTELRQRIQSWWWMLGLLFAVLLINTYAAIIFIAFLSFLALKEFFSITPTRLSDRPVIFWAYVTIPLQYYWVATAQFGMFLVFIPVYAFLMIPTRMVLTGETHGFIKSVATIIWAIMLTVFSLSHVAYLLVLPVQNSLAGGVGLVLFIVLMTECNDVAQYIWGKLLGRHKIIPKVSPNKTREGFLGGLLTVTIASGLLGPFLTPLNWYQALAAGLIIGLGGFVGDVVISAVKRDLRIKDSGTLIPGHGGVLDRLDSLIYTAPLFFHYINYLCCVQ